MISQKVPTIVSVYLERPADLSRVTENATAIIGHFGLLDDVLVDAITGHFSPSARLPYDLPWTGPVPGQIAHKSGQGLTF